MGTSPEELQSNAEDVPGDSPPNPGENPEDGAHDPGQSPPLPRVRRRYNLSREGRERLSRLGKSRWAAQIEAEQREADLDQREEELIEAGPEFLGMVKCRECGSWLESEDNLARHQLTIHPPENAVAGETKTSPERVTAVWIEACDKQNRHPTESPEHIVRRFWDSKDREILERLLARGAVFRYREDG